MAKFVMVFQCLFKYPQSHCNSHLKFSSCRSSPIWSAAPLTCTTGWPTSTRVTSFMLAWQQYTKCTSSTVSIWFESVVAKQQENILQKNLDIVLDFEIFFQCDQSNPVCPIIPSHLSFPSCLIIPSVFGIQYSNS